MGLVGKMRRMNKDKLTMLHRHVDVSLQGFDFVRGGLVQSGLPDAQTIGLVEKFRHEAKNLVGEFFVFRFFGIDRNPTEVTYTEFRSPSRLEL